MKELPLYTDYELPIEKEQGRRIDVNCGRCSLWRDARTICMPAAGEPGGILFVGDYPGRVEDRVGRPFVGPAGKYLTEQVKKIWDGPFAFTNAIGCYPGPNSVTAKHVDACRGYLAKTIKDVEPKRIVIMGGNAALSIFGEALPILSMRRGVGWIWGEDKKVERDLFTQPTFDMVPVFILMNPVNSLRNKFLRKWFEQDLKWALTSSIESLWMPPTDSVVRVIETEEDAIEIFEIVKEAGGFTFDVETAGKLGNKFFKILSASVTPFDSEEAWVWPEEALENEETGYYFKALLEDPNIEKCGHNLKYDVESSEYALDTEVANASICTMLIRKLLWSDVSGRLEHMGYLVGMGGHKREMQQALAGACASIMKARREKKKAAGFLPGTVSEVYAEAVKSDLEPEAFAYGLVKKSLLYRYNGGDTIATERLRRWQEPQLDKHKTIKRVWSKVVTGTSEAIAQVETWGMPVSRSAIENYDTYLKQKIAGVEKRFAKYDANPASPKQMVGLLYDKLGLPVKVETDKGVPSTGKAALEAIKEKHPIVKDLLLFRALSKLQGTYAEGMLKHIRDDGRVHSNLNIDGAASGRLSSSDPNCQNIPRGDDEHAKLARNCFVAPPGYRIIQLDYSQLELRIAALLSGDKAMKQIFFDGIDYHQGTANIIAELAWGLKPEQLEKKHRTQAKTLNFAVLYGKSDKGVAEQVGITVEEAIKVKNALFGTMRDLKSWIDECLEETQRTGFTWTWWDGERARRRPLWRIGNNSEDANERKARGTAERSSWNTVIQGTASDFCLASLVECVKWIKEDCVPAELIMAVHDSLMFLTKEEYVDEVARGAHDIMVSWNSGDVPLIVDVEVGQAWGSLKDYKI